MSATILPFTPTTPTAQALAAGHPSVYDWRADDDRPAIPRIVALSLSVLIAAGKRAGGQVGDAAEIVDAWARGIERDATPAHGTPRGSA